jgi:hypothetical protein
MLDRLFEIFKSKTPIQRMYPELDKIPLTYARIENGQKFSQVYIGAEEKIYLI